MNYLKNLFSEENIENFNRFEQEFNKIEKKDIYFTEKSLEDSSIKEEIPENIEFEEEENEFSTESVKNSKEAINEEEKVNEMFKYNPREIVNANRSKSSTNIIYTSFFPKYKENIDKGKNNLIKFVMSYIRDHIVELSTRGPSKHVVWGKSNESDFFRCVNISSEEVRKIIKSCPFIKSSWMIPNNPCNMLMVVLICYFWNDMTDKEKKEIETEKYKEYLVFIMNLIFTIRFYSSIQRKYFPYEADEEIMNTVVDELSGRYNLKSFNSMYELLEFIAYTNILNTKDIMNNPSDYNLDYFMNNLNGRINSTIKGIVNEYRTAYENNKAGGEVEKINKTNNEGDQYLDIATNVSNDISLITRKILIKLTSDSTVDETLLEIACKQTKIASSKMKVSINNMIANDKELIGKLINLILSYYLGTLKKDKKTIRSINFISVMKKVYSVSNTNSPIVIEIKNVLDALLKNNSKEYLTTNRAATLSNLKATSYLYWVLYINSRVE